MTSQLRRTNFCKHIFFTSESTVVFDCQTRNFSRVSSKISSYISTVAHARITRRGSSSFSVSRPRAVGELELYANFGARDTRTRFRKTLSKPDRNRVWFMRKKLILILPCCKNASVIIKLMETPNDGNGNFGRINWRNNISNFFTWKSLHVKMRRHAQPWLIAT